MSDAAFIESIAVLHEQKEIFFRSIGMFELAEWYQWAADSIRQRQPTHCTRGSGGTSIAVYLSDGWLYALGDMTPGQAQEAGRYLTTQACKALGGGTFDLPGDLTKFLSTIESMIDHFKKPKEPTVEVDEGPY